MVVVAMNPWLPGGLPNGSPGLTRTGERPPARVG